MSCVGSQQPGHRSANAGGREGANGREPELVEMLAWGGATQAGVDSIDCLKGGVVVEGLGNSTDGGLSREGKFGKAVCSATGVDGSDSGPPTTEL